MNAIWSGLAVDERLHLFLGTTQGRCLLSLLILSTLIAGGSRDLLQKVADLDKLRVVVRNTLLSQCLVFLLTASVIASVYMSSAGR